MSQMGDCRLVLILKVAMQTEYRARKRKKVDGSGT